MTLETLGLPLSAYDELPSPETLAMVNYTSRKQSKFLGSFCNAESDDFRLKVSSLANYIQGSQSMTDNGISDESGNKEFHSLGIALNPRKRLRVYSSFSNSLTKPLLNLSIEQTNIKTKIRKQIKHLGLLIKHKTDTIKHEEKLKETIIKYFNTFNKLKNTKICHQSINSIIRKLEQSTISDYFIPLVYPDGIPFIVDPASFLISKLETLLSKNPGDETEADFFAKRKESHVRLAKVLSQTKYPFYKNPKIDKNQIINLLTQTNGKPNSENEIKIKNLLEVSTPKKPKLDGEFSEETVSDFKKLVLKLKNLVKVEKLISSEVKREEQNSYLLISKFLERLHRSHNHVTQTSKILNFTNLGADRNPYFKT